jgi:hypothetical protein
MKSQEHGGTNDAAAERSESVKARDDDARGPAAPKGIEKQDLYKEDGGES